ncbi:MAG: DUF4956 domain-containing protein [Bacteroidales bacterium]|nr:DUF4956 domain-containing protein [Bacteroidales bacterium]
MNSAKLLFLIMLLFATPSFGQSLSAIESEILAEETDSKDAKAEAKKKDKDIIEINSRFFITLGIDVAAVLLIILVVYYPNYRKMDTIFTFILFNIIIFLLTFVLNKVKISMGAAFGLFAVFSMLRYRTAGIGMKDMTYLFIFIAMDCCQAFNSNMMSWESFAVLSSWSHLSWIQNASKREQSKNIQFEKIELVKPEYHDRLMEELKLRTGLNIHRISVNRLDYLKDIASIRIYYYE